MTAQHLQLFFEFFLGIVLSVVLPIGIKWLKEAQDTATKGGMLMGRVKAFATPYAKVGLGSAIVGAMLVAVFLAAGGKAEETPWYNAVLYGFAWDSVLQKFRESLRREPDQPRPPANT
jgi:hypothetical protein